MNFYLDEGRLPPYVKPNPQGQVMWNVPGTYTWVCPENVNTVALAMVAGGAAAQRRSNRNYNGMGGNLRWVNALKVVPGQAYTIVVGRANAERLQVPSTALGYSTATAVGGVLQGVNGGPEVEGANRFGGNAGLVDTTNVGAASGYGIDLKTMKAVTNAAAGVNRNTERAGLPAGGGGGVWSNANGDSFRTFEGGAGAVRIIWGDDRAFPAQNILDVTPRS